jgi:hypothetical protein
MKSAKLPPGAYSAGVPGTKANAALKRAPIRTPVQISEKFLADARGGPELVARHGVAVADNRTRTKR